MDEEKQNGKSNLPPGTLTVQIAPEKVRELLTVDQSIQRWSVKHMNLSLELRGIESTAHTLHEHKGRIMEAALKDVGVDMSKFSSAHMAADGTVHLVSNQGAPSPAGREAPQPADDRPSDG